MAKIWYKINNKNFEDTTDVYIYLKEQMTKGEYLYGQRIKGLKDMRNEDAYLLKIKLSKALVKHLMDVSYLYKDDNRILASLHSQKFNQELLNEMYENDK